MVEKFETQLDKPTNLNYINVPKVVKPTNKKMILSLWKNSHKYISLKNEEKKIINFVTFSFSILTGITQRAS